MTAVTDGRVVSIAGPVVDVEFFRSDLPDINTALEFDITVDLSIPLPGFLLKRALKGGTESATEGLRKQVLKIKKGG